MLPDNEYYDDFDDDTDDDVGFSVSTIPSLTYAMYLDRKDDKKIFVGKVDELDAIKQSVMKILNTERYEHEIYSWDYGIELRDLRGKSITYVMSEVKERIKDALLQDDRIKSVDNFEIKRTGTKRKHKNSLYVKFRTTTAQNEEFDTESEVDI